MTASEYMEVVNSWFNNFNKDTLLSIVHAFHNWKLPFKRFLIEHLLRQRITREANNLKLYADLIDQLNDDELEEIMLPELVTICKELLEKTEASPANKEALRNVGTFLGLVTIVRNKPIPAEHINFRSLLENAVSSKNEVRLTLAIVFVTHVFKYCQFSLIFRQNCTWVSRIIDIVNTIYENSSNKLYISLEIERFSDGLKKMGETETELDAYFKVVKPTQTCTAHRHSNHQQNNQSASSFSANHPMFPQSSQCINQNQFNVQQHQHTSMKALSSSHFCPNYMHHSSIMDSQYQSSNNQMHNSHISPYQSYNTGSINQKGVFYSQHSGNENGLAFIVRHLKFDDVPILAETLNSRTYVSSAFAEIMGRVEENFFDRVKDTLLSTCDTFLLCDMAFCNNLQQLNLTYKQAIQAYLIALLIPPESIESVISDLYDLLGDVFFEVAQNEMMLHENEEENEKYVMDNVAAFVEKNQGVVTDSLCTLVDRRSTKLAMQSASRCINRYDNSSLAHEAFVLSRFVGHPSELQQVNYSLPPKLQRLDYTLNEEGLQVYKQFGELSAKCQKYMESVSLQSLHQVKPLEESENQFSFDPRQQSAYFFENEEWSENDSETSTSSLEDIGADDLKNYVRALYSKNPNKDPDFFFEYVQLVLQPQFLDQLMGTKLTPKDSSNYLTLLVLPVLQLVTRLSRQGKLTDVNGRFNSMILTLFTTLIDKYPQVFDANYLVFSGAIPDVLLRLRNMIMNCMPVDIELPSISLDLQQLLTSPQMNVDLDIDNEVFFSRLPEDLKKLIDFRMQHSNDPNFVTKILSALQTSNHAYDRTKLIHVIVYVAHLAIKTIHKSMLVVERVTLLNNQGQTILIKLLEALNNDGRYVALTMMVDQLRYPNCMTAYFMCFLLNLFQSTTKSEIREMLFRALIDRFMPLPPYPWGLCVAMKELLKNRMFKLRSYDFARCSPEIVHLIDRVETLIGRLG